MKDLFSPQPAKSDFLYNAVFFLFFLLVLLTLTIVIVKYFKDNKAKNQAVQPQIKSDIPAPSTPNVILFQGNYQKKNYQSNFSDNDLRSLPLKLKNSLTSSDDNSLLGMRCSEKIVNEEFGFYIREQETHDPIRQITDEKIIKILKTADEFALMPNKLMTAKICELENGDMLLEYTTGTQIHHHPDEGYNVTAYLSYIENGQGFNPGLEFINYELWPYPGCRGPLQITKDKKVYYECAIATEKEVNSTYHLVDFSGNSSILASKCVFTYKGKPAKNCS